MTSIFASSMNFIFAARKVMLKTKVTLKTKKALPEAEPFA